MKYLPILLAICSIILTACPQTDLEIGPNGCTEIVFRNIPEIDPEAIPEIRNVTISNHCLDISYAYGGGCEEVPFKLIQTSPIADWPNVSLVLQIEDNDLCKALVYKTASFDISTYRTENPGSVTLSIQGWDESIVYTWP